MHSEAPYNTATAHSFNEIPTGMTDLHHAAKSGDLARCNALVAQGVKVDALAEDGYTPLHVAAINGHVGISTLLLNAGANPRASFSNGWTALHITAQQGHVAICKLIIKALNHGKASINRLSSLGTNALHLSILHNHPDILQTLLDAGADASQTTADGWTPLHLVIQKNSLPMLDALLGALSHKKTKINPILSNRHNWTPLHLAILRQCNRTTTKLLHAGANIHAITSEGWTPLHLAAEQGNLDVCNTIIQALIARKSNLDAPNLKANGSTALHCGTLQGHTHICIALIASGADPYAKNKDGITAFHFAAKHRYLSVFNALTHTYYFRQNVPKTDQLAPLLLATTINDFDVCDALLASGANLQAQLSDGCNILHVAVEGGNLTICNILIEMFIRKGISLDLKNTQRHTALHFSAMHNQPDMCKALLQAGSDINAENHQQHNALFLSIYHKHHEVSAILMAQEPTVNVVTSDHQTPLFYAIKHGNIDECKALIRLHVQQNVEFNTQNLNGYTALHVACMNGSMPICSMLIDAMVQNTANLHTTTHNGETALHIAARNNHPHVCKKLLASGAQPSIKAPNGWTPLHIAAQYGYIAVCHILIAAMVKEHHNLDTPNAQGVTPLHLAVINNHPLVCKTLIAYGACAETSFHKPFQMKNMANGDTLIELPAEKTAIDLAIESKYDDVLKTMIHTTILKSQAYMGYAYALTDSLRKTIVDCIQTRPNWNTYPPNAFSHTSNLFQLSLKNPIRCVEKNAFSHCKNLVSIEISKDIHTIQDLAFANCPFVCVLILPEDSPFRSPSEIQRIGIKSEQPRILTRGQYSKQFAEFTTYYSNKHYGYSKEALSILFCYILNMTHSSYFDFFNGLYKLLGKNAMLHPAMFDKLTPWITESTSPIHKPLLLHGMFALKELASIRITARTFAPHCLPSTEEEASDANQSASDPSHAQLVP